MKFVDTVAEFLYFKEAIEEARSKVIQSGVFLLGEETRNLEEEFKSEIVNGMHCTAVKNCTDALIIVLTYILKEHPEAPIILPNFGAYPTALAAANVSHNLHYVDVDESYTLNPECLPDLYNGVIVPVHLFGNNCDMTQIMEYAQSHNHIVLEDCAQSTGSGSGREGDFSVFSFYPTKPLACMGDGGMICSKSIENDYHFQKYRFYGQDFKTRNIEFVGINSRIDEFQASIVRTKLKGFHTLNNRRRKIAHRYKKIVKGMSERGHCVYHQFPIRFHDREIIANNLEKSHIPYVIHYSSHVCDYDFLNPHNYEVNNRVCDTIISLPCHPFMADNEVQRVENFLYEFREQELQ